MLKVARKEESSPTNNQRGEDARRRLIDAAIETFGDLGFDGTSTRTLAERAGVNLAAIPYYFGSKQGLYRAAANHIVDRISEQMAPITRRIESLPSGKIPRRTIVRHLHEFLDRFATVIIGSGEADAWSLFIMRELMQPGAAFEIFYEGSIRPLADQCAHLLARLANQSPEQTAIKIRTNAILGEILIFRNGRTAALKWLGWNDLNPQRLSLVRSIMKENVDRIIGKLR